MFRVLVLFILLCLLSTASAQFLSNGLGGAGLSGGLGNPGIANGGSGGNPPSCSNSLDFTKACNSQYITVIMP
jgi:hypothetical protein